MRVAGWRLPERDGILAIEPSLKDLYRAGRRRRLIAVDSGGDAHAMHRWRKRVKELRYAAEMIDRSDEVGHFGQGKGKRDKRARKRARARGEADFVRRLARRADELGELLGADHDLVMLAERVRADGSRDPATGRMPRKIRKALLELIERRRRRLRGKIMRAGRRLYRDPPKQFLARLRTAHRRAARPLS